MSQDNGQYSDSNDVNIEKKNEPLPVNPTQDQDSQTLLFESQHHNTLDLIDAIDGSSIRIPLTVETAAVDLRTGAKQFTIHNVLAIGVDGFPAAPGSLFPCRGCDHGFRYTERAITTCGDCGIVLGIPCCAKGQTVPRCRSCRRLRFWQTVCKTITTLYEQKL